jgi:predicted Zn finger-like uncharacterized protein
MILTCPNCGTQYVVKDGAIPPQGRQVRCASCRHSWHQDADVPIDLGLSPEAEVGATEEQPETIADVPVIEPRSGPEAEERAYEEAAIAEALDEDRAESAVQHEEWHEPSPLAAESADYDAPPGPELQAEDEFSPFAERDYVEPRRRSPLVMVLLLIVVVAAAAAAFWFFAPTEWKARLGLAEAATPLQLSNPPHVERRPLASGQDLLTVAGRVINPTDEPHPVPPIYAELYDRGGKLVYRWTIAPPTQTLAPGASASFNSAEVNVPAGAEELTISLGPPKA